MKCEACERGDHDECGMQTWCDCDCEGHQEGAYIPDGSYFQDDLDGGRLVKNDEVEGPEPMAVATYGPEAPKTHEEARFFHDGFLAGATAYAAAVGHPCLKSDNEKLREVFDTQGWRTIETFEKLAEAVLVCEHGVKDGDWCEPCNKEMKRAAQAEGN